MKFSKTLCTTFRAHWIKVFVCQACLNRLLRARLYKVHICTYVLHIDLRHIRYMKVVHVERTNTFINHCRSLIRSFCCEVFNKNTRFKGNNALASDIISSFTPLNFSRWITLQKERCVGPSIRLARWDSNRIKMSHAGQWIYFYFIFFFYFFFSIGCKQRSAGNWEFFYYSTIIIFTTLIFFLYNFVSFFCNNVTFVFKMSNNDSPDLQIGNNSKIKFHA